MRISVVVPTLNEARWLAAAVGSVRDGARAGGAFEVVVADCGSADGTVELARELGCRVVGGAEGEDDLDARGPAADAGGRAARGDVLLFLDADCRLPPGWDRAVAGALADPEVVGGGFEFSLDGPGPGLRVVEAVDRLRYRTSHLFYGDQAVFVRAEAWRAVGGFRGARILESAQLCRRLKKRGRLELLPFAVAASPRRFERGGVARVLAADVALWLAGLLRLPIDRLGGTLYWRENRRRR